MLDGTVAVEIAAERALVQWPFLTDMTLVDALVRRGFIQNSIFTLLQVC